MKPLVLGLGGVSVIGIGSAGAYLYVTSSKTIREELKGRKLTSSLKLAKDEMKEQWQEEFTTNKVAIKAVIKEITDDEKGGEELEKWCASSLDKTSEKSLLDNVKRWCTVHTVEEKIGKPLLGDNSTTEEWGALWTKNTDTTKRASIQLKGTPNNQHKDQDLKKIKDFCNKNKMRDFLVKEKATVYDLVSYWCTK